MLLFAQPRQFLPLLPRPGKPRRRSLARFRELLPQLQPVRVRLSVPPPTPIGNSRLISRSTSAADPRSSSRRKPDLCSWSSGPNGEEPVDGSCPSSMHWRRNTLTGWLSWRRRGRLRRRRLPNRRQYCCHRVSSSGASTRIKESSRCMACPISLRRCWSHRTARSSSRGWVRDPRQTCEPRSRTCWPAERLSARRAPPGECADLLRTPTPRRELRTRWLGR